MCGISCLNGGKKHTLLSRHRYFEDFVAAISFVVNLKNLTSEQHSANCISKTCLFSDAFRPANVDFYREFYNNTLNACI